MTASPIHHTPLYERHVALGGRMVDFGGWELPQQYTSIKDEHLAVRNVAGLFDVSHMGRLIIEGSGAEAYLQRLITNDVTAVRPGHSIYSQMCLENGGVIDDLVAYRQAPDRFMVVVNASNREKDVAWMRQHLPPDVALHDISSEVSLIAFQGPRAASILPAEKDTDDIPYFGFRQGKVAGVDATISRTGYTGEDGFELFVDSGAVGAVWDAILAAGRQAGVLPAGLGARDATRLEAALRLYGNDMDETVNPYEAGLGWTVKLSKGDFIGRTALARIREEGPKRTLIGLKSDPGSIPRHGAAVTIGGKRAGAITSGTHSFFLGYPIALALVEASQFHVGDKVAVEVRGREAPVDVVKLPFYRGSARSVVAPTKT
ncbi:MAG: glycine cleavage system aminomethyltransferase GcvT [Candidatus Dormibacterales bacterium]